MQSLCMAIVSGPTSDELALFLVQVMIILSLVRILGRFLVKIRQPMVIGEIIAGILLGPSAFGQIPNFTDSIFPTDSLAHIKLFANIGLIFFMFFLGLEVDIDHMKKSLRQSVPIAVCSIVVPFACGAVLSLWFYDIETTSSSFTTFLLFLGTSLSFTAFPVLARVLTSAKLVTSPVGGQALGCAAVDDLLAWCTLAVTLSYASGGGIVAGIYVALITLGLVLFLVFVIRPFLVWYHQRLIAQDDELNRNFLALLFLLLCLTAWFSEILGIEAFCGSFIFGIMVPKEGQLIDNLAPKIELLIVEFFLPLYFANSGLRTNIGGLNQGSDWGAVFAVIAIGSAAKMIPVTLLARLTVRLNKYGQLFSMAQAAEANAGGDDLVPALHAVEPADEGTPMPWRQCLTLGVLMNTRGLIALIVLNIGLSADILGTKVFTIMVVFSLVTTFVTPPSVHYLYAAPYHAAREAKLKEVELIELDSMAKQRQVDEMLEEEANDVVNVFPPSDATVNDGSASPTGDEQHAHPALQGAEVRLSVDAGGEGTVAAVGVDAPVTRLHIYPAQRSPSVSVSHLDRREADILATQLAAFGNTDHTGVELARREPVHRADSHHNTGSRKLGSRQASHDSHAAPRFIEEAESPVTHLTSAIGDFFFGPAHPTVVEEEEDEQRSLSVRHALADAARREEAETAALTQTGSFRTRHGEEYRHRRSIPSAHSGVLSNNDINRTGPSGFGRAARHYPPSATINATQIGSDRRHSLTASPPIVTKQLHAAAAAASFGASASALPAGPSQTTVPTTSTHAAPTASSAASAAASVAATPIQQRSRANSHSTAEGEHHHPTPTFHAD